MVRGRGGIRLYERSNMMEAHQCELQTAVSALSHFLSSLVARWLQPLWGKVHLITHGKWTLIMQYLQDRLYYCISAVPI